MYELVKGKIGERKIMWVFLSNITVLPSLITSLKGKSKFIYFMWRGFWPLIFLKGKLS